MLSKLFFLAGKAEFTIEPSKADQQTHNLKPHYVFRIRRARVGSALNVYVMSSWNKFRFDWLGTLDQANGEIVRPVRPASDQATRVFLTVVPALFAGRVSEIEAKEWNIHHSGHCCRCGRKLVAPASLEVVMDIDHPENVIGVGPECRPFVLGNFPTPQSVPQTSLPLVARMQAAYWMAGGRAALKALFDACLDSDLSDERAAQIVAATKGTMRIFKKGAKWPAAFRAAVGA